MSRPRAQRGGGGEQQQIQPRQTDVESGLFELGVVRNKGDNVEVKVKRHLTRVGLISKEMWCGFGPFVSSEPNLKC